MERKILYIVNPISGGGSKSALQELIKVRTQAAGIPFEIYPSVASGDYTFLDEVITSVGYTDIAIAGGDGTINQAVNGLRHHDVQFGIIPCGSGNGLALSAGISKNAETALQIIFEGKGDWTDAFTINGQFACMLCGLGFDAQVAHDFAKDPSRGLSTYIKHTIRDFFKAKCYTFKLTINDRSLLMDAFFISIANSNQFGNNFTIAPKALLTDGLLDIVVMARQSKLSLLLQSVRQVIGLNRLQQVEVLNEHSSVLYFQTPALHITNAMEAPLHIDGDPAETAREFDIRLLHRCFRLIHP